MRIGRLLPAVLLVYPVVALPLLLAACAKPEPAPTPTPAASPTPEDPVAAGRALYLSKGCAGCHGQEAEGTAIAHSLPGHTADQVLRQVRAPVGKMPAFTNDQVTDRELDMIAAFIASLDPGVAHVEPLEIEDPLATHLWMAIIALKDGNVLDAIHHIDHAIEMVDDPEHKHQLEEARELVQAGEYHEAEHEIEEMLAEKIVPDLSLMQLHLRLALVAVEARRPEDAVHHMEHFLMEATLADKVKGLEVIDHLKAREYHEAGEEIESLMNMEVQGH